MRSEQKQRLCGDEYVGTLWGSMCSVMQQPCKATLATNVEQNFTMSTQFTL